MYVGARPFERLTESLHSDYLQIIPVSQVLPVHPAVQLHVFGAIQVPLLKHSGEQTAAYNNN